MTDIAIVLGDKSVSSWSLRGWIALKATGVPFTEIMIRLRRGEATRADILRHSPSGKVPLLKHKGTLVWESLAICEFLAETYPAAGLWPADPAARALARSVAAEMHAGFAALRSNMPMDMRASLPGQGMAEGVQADIDRIAAIWRECREKHGKDGPFLFGRFTAADAMYAPVVSRFITYGVKLDPICAAYRDAMWQHSAMQEWLAAAKREP
ncbi:MAG TPA: glutathione S-transferase family protein [Alphaproteobacteria bacterium]|nr:glutathione S-transferase family protein [Alphaproteobacteria bacterium]